MARGCQPAARPAKPNEVHLAFSRDGFHWDRPNRKPFLAPSEKPGAWNWGNVQSAGGGFCVVGDELFIYYSGRGGSPGGDGKVRDTGAATGLARLRRDGFASLDAGPDGGTLATRPLTFGKGRHLFVNADAHGGTLSVEILDAKTSQPIPPFVADGCRSVTAEGTRQRVLWDGAADLGALAGKTVRLRFHLRQASLYAFWVSPYEKGHSGGYVAAGGPGFAGPRDEL